MVTDLRRFIKQYVKPANDQVDTNRLRYYIYHIYNETAKESSGTGMAMEMMEK